MEKADEERIRNLERRVAWLEQQALPPAWLPYNGPAGDAAPPAAVSPVRSSAKPAPALDAPYAPSPAAESAFPFAERQTGGPTPLARRPTAPGPLPRFEPAPAKKPVDLEKVLGANWLARVGVVVLALGVVFFLKLAYDNDWVPRLGRIAIGVMGGLALFLTGHLLSQRRTDAAFTQILSAGGAIIAYASLYAAYALPDYRAELGVSLVAEIAMLAVVSAGVAAYAVWRRLPIMAGLSASLAAFLVAPAGTFSAAGAMFLGLMGAAILAACAWRRWTATALTSLAILDAALLVGTWASMDLAPWLGASAIAIHLAALWCANRHAGEEPYLGQGLAVASILALAFVGRTIAVDARIADLAGWTLLGVGTLGVVAGLFLRRLTAPLVLAGGVVLALWPLQQFDLGLTRIGAYAALAILALAATFAFKRSARPLRDAAGVYLALGTLMQLLWGLQDRAALADWQGSAMAATLGGLSVALWLTSKADGPTTFGTATSWVTLGVMLCAWPFIQYPSSLTALFMLVAACAGLMGLAFAMPARSLVANLLACAVAAVGIAGLFALGAGQGFVDRDPAQTGLVAALLVGCTAALGLGPRASRDASGGIGLALTGVLLVFWPWAQFPTSGHAALAMAGGAAAATLAARWRTARHKEIGALALAAAAAAVLHMAWRPWITREDLLLGGAATALVCASCALLWLQARDGPLGRLRIAPMAVGYTAPIFAIAQALDGWAIATAWGALALAATAVSFASRQVELRVAPFALFGLVVGRIFLVDLSGLGLPQRALAFVLTGALLLAGAYLFARQRKGAQARGHGASGAATLETDEA